MNKIIKTEFETIIDPRGWIKKVATGVDVLSIFSRKGIKRAAHFHLETSHLCNLLIGKMLYFERPANSSIKPIKLEINPGDYFFTDKMKEHLMCFLEDSVFDCYSYGSREKVDYEKDLVRLDFDLEDIYNNWKD